MRYINLFLFAALSALTLSCNKEIESNQPTATDGITEISASFADGHTKTVLGSDEKTVLWSPNDEISVFYDGDGMKFTGINSTPKSKTIFMSSGMFLYGGTEGASEDKNYFYGIYPYASDNAQYGDKLTLTIPAVQNTVKGTFASGAYPSIARSKTTDLAFYNVCGGIRFKVSQSGIYQIIISGNDNETIAGKVNVSFGVDGKPIVMDYVEENKEIKLSTLQYDCFEVGQWYYISVLPVNFENGLTITFYKRSSTFQKGTRTIANVLSVKRSVFGSIENIDNGVIFEDFEPEGFVDLGLSVLWATCNLGADKPEDYGRYFACGDVVGQTWDGSKWSGGGFSEFPSYELDANNNLKPEYDAAHVLLGGSWRMPTGDEEQELIDNCTSTWTSNYEGTGVAGRIFASKKAGYTDKSIFLPAAGYGYLSYLNSAGSSGEFWSSTVRKDYYAWYLYCSSDDVDTYYFTLNDGRSVRPVSE